MKNDSLKRDMIFDEGGSEPMQSRGPKLIYKFMFFAFGILSALTIFVLIRLSNNLTLEKKKQALRHFEELASHIIGQSNHPK